MDMIDIWEKGGAYEIHTGDLCAGRESGSNG